jgi:MFS family permease
LTQAISKHLLLALNTSLKISRTESLSVTTYRRDHVFWLAALQTGVFGIFMGGFRPALPLLREEQGTSAAVAGLHGTAIGLASIVAGILNARIVHHLGRRKSVWLGLGIFNIGALGFVILPDAWQTITAIFLGGIGLSITINNTFMKLDCDFTASFGLLSRSIWHRKCIFICSSISY